MCDKSDENLVLQDIIRSRKGKLEAVCRPALKIGMRRYGGSESARRTKALHDKLQNFVNGVRRDITRGHRASVRDGILLHVAMLLLMGLMWWTPHWVMWQKIDYSEKAETFLTSTSKNKFGMKQGKGAWTKTGKAAGTPKHVGPP